MYKTNLLDSIACACSTYQKEDGYYCEYLVIFEELKRFFGEINVLTLIKMFMFNTCCALYN